MGKLDGSCLCGAITYTSEAEPAFAAICHCKACQRQGGTAFSLVVGVPTAELEIKGDTLKSFTTTPEDFDGETERQFCSECGSPVVTLSPGLPDVSILKAGTLDDTSWIEPQLEVWGSSAQHWIEPVEGRPRLDRSVQGSAQT